LLNLARQPVRIVRALPDALKAAGSLALGGIPKLPSFIAPKTSLNQTITSQRAWAMQSLPLDAAKRIAKQTGTSLNDVVMAICSGALRRYLHDKDDLPRKSLTSAVPVSLREQGNCEMNNQVFAMLCSLATDVADPAERLLAIHRSAQQSKRFTGHIKSAVPREFSVFGAPLLMQGAMALYNRSGLGRRLPPMFNVPISNVPGPQMPLYLAGAKLLTLYPVSLVGHGFGLNITVQSYNGALDFGLTACRRTLPDVHKLADHIGAAAQELQAAVLGETAETPEKAEVIELVLMPRATGVAPTMKVKRKPAPARKTPRVSAPVREPRPAVVPSEPMRVSNGRAFAGAKA
jgi:WS/DGAT/MGAT family acyltransferase